MLNLFQHLYSKIPNQVRNDRDNFHRGLKEGIAEGITQGSQQAKIETAKNFISMGLSVEQVAQGTGLSIETVKSLK